MKIYYSSIKQYSWIILVCTVIAVITAFSLARSQTVVLQVSSIIFIDEGTPDSSIPSLLGSSATGLNKNGNYAALLMSRSSLGFVYQSNPEIGRHGYTLDDLVKHVSVSPSSADATITITVTSNNANDAVLLANDVANGFALYIQIQYQKELDNLRSDMQQRLIIYQQQKNSTIVNSLQSQLSLLPLSVQSDVRVIQLATSTNVVPVSKTSLIIGATAGTGILLGIILMVLMIFLDNRLRSDEQVKQNLGFAYLGNISTNKQITANHTLIPGSMKQELTNIWANLYLANILTSQKNTPSGAVLLVTSTQNAEGKTTVAAALATVTVQDGSSVVVIDGNLHQPSTHLAFGMNNAGLGLNGLLKGTEGGFVDAAVQRSGIPGVWLLPAGTPVDNATFLLKRELPKILAQLRKKTDLIIIDASSLLSNAEASLMATMADGVIFVVDSRHSKLPLLLRAKEILTSLSHKPTGVVLNHFVGSRSNRYYVATLNQSIVTTEKEKATANEVNLNNGHKSFPTQKPNDTDGDANYTPYPWIGQSAVPHTDL